MTARGLAVIALALLLAGCMSTGTDQWARSGEDATMKRDIYECKADADGVSHRATAFGGAIMPIVGLFSRRDTFNECMESRGYVKGR